jgi:hypothetical protein
VEGPPDLDLVVPGTHRLTGLAAPWDHRPLQVWGRQDDRMAAVVVFFDDSATAEPCETQKESRTDRLSEQRCWAVGTLLGVEEDCGEDDIAVHEGGPKVRIRLRSGGISLSIERSVGPDRLILWTGRPTDSGIELAAPIEPWDN